MLFPKPSLQRTQSSAACLPGILGEASDRAQARLAGSPLRAPLSASTAEPACGSSCPKSWREDMPGGSATGTRCLQINCILQLNCPIPQRTRPAMSRGAGGNPSHSRKPLLDATSQRHRRLLEKILLCVAGVQGRGGGGGGVETWKQGCWLGGASGWSLGPEEGGAPQALQIRFPPHSVSFCFPFSHSRA